MMIDKYNLQNHQPLLRFRTRILISLMLIGFTGYGQTITFTINTKNKAQTIDNFGASGAWFSEGIGKFWPENTKAHMAELLFSKAFNQAGNPLGIGLSAWRFNIGGGTAEQGDSSGISNPVKRVECFLSPNGTYDWSRQEGYLWFVKKAAQYGVENLIAFSNTPPVQFTKNGLGFKTEKDYKPNLKEDKYADYAGFLATVLQHFDHEGLHFNYVSPVNEPQWDWSNQFGKMNQEGSPWDNKSIYKIVLKLDSALSAKKLSTKIMIPEAGILTALYEGKGQASTQIQNLYGKNSMYNLGKMPHVLKAAAGHSYFTDAGDTSIVNVRKNLRDTAAKYKIPFWQSEYSMLGNGYKDGAKGKIAAIDCALFLSKIIYHDLVIAGASAWQFWNAWEPGDADFDTRYYLLALKNNAANTEGDFTITKNLWALGQYSRFIRPGMQRIITQRNDGLNNIQAAQNVLLSAFTDDKTVVVVAVNYTRTPQPVSLKITGIKKARNIKKYVTNVQDNMRPYLITAADKIILQPRSMVTIVLQQ